MIHLIYSLTVIVLETVCIDIFFSAFGTKRRNSKWLNIALYALMLGLVYVISSSLRNNIFLKIMSIALIIALVMYLVYRIDILKCIVMSVLFEAIDGLWDSLILLIGEQTLGNISSIQSDLDIAGNVIIVVSKSLLFLSVIVITSLCHLA